MVSLPPTATWEHLMRILSSIRALENRIPASSVCHRWSPQGVKSYRSEVSHWSSSLNSQKLILKFVMRCQDVTSIGRRDPPTVNQIRSDLHPSALVVTFSQQLPEPEMSITG